ncbi:GNAT family N-acetyltransferase [Pinibacter aurantiacus]|uniref:GNAT family N-acetyltransferase n=1 Tax=Pinibacter aurantiacus TaxID=2851599 RepID=A0A9E2S910_9BACT|nr:GNAT family N-acetyltransferase [Pinibacter aurantiacus]MBV4356909.1 GNAT family N-acetyltransferase [Pinibacter aurantiacus]
MSETISYIQRREIDIEKWNACVEVAPNGLIYARSWWLDEMADNWDALVVGDYDVVMPLTWKSKYGIKYLYQPYFTASLGPFYKPGNKIALKDFIKAIPAAFKFVDIDINEFASKDNVTDPGISTVSRTNYLIPCTNEYDGNKSYNRLAKRKINVALSSDIIFSNEVSIDSIISKYKENYQDVHRSISDADYKRLAAVCNFALDKKNISTYGAFHGGELIAFYLVLHDQRYAYSLLGGSNAAGKEMGAFYFLTHRAIEDAKLRKNTFRFEGSDIEGIAFFNKQFGSVPVSYLHIKINRLPWPLSLMKQ